MWGGSCAGLPSPSINEPSLRASWEIPHPFGEENIWTKQLGAAEEGLAKHLRGSRAARGKEQAGF